MSNMKKRLSLCVAVLMTTTALAACSKEEPQQAVQPDNAPQSVTFPLKEQVTLRIDVSKLDKDSKFFEDLALTKQMEKETNVKIEWNVLSGDSKQIDEKKKIMFASDSYGDVVINMTDQDFMNFSAAGLILPLEKYMNEKNTPNIMELFKKLPTTKNVVTFPDGHIYTIPKYTGFKENFIENRIWMNKTWLDTLGLAVPKTTDELYAVLKAFKDKDPNGNGKPDEIPLTLVDEHAFMHMESLMGMWGLATKSGLFDSYLALKNNKVVFAPTDPAFKDGMKYLNKLYQEKLLDNEVFTQKEANAFAKIGSATDTVGMFVNKTNMAKNRDHYIAIAPPNAPGYEASWYVHPGSVGARSKMAVTKSNKYPEITLAWFDKFYTTRDTYIAQFGLDSLTEEAGVLKFKPIPAGTTEDKFYDGNSYMKTDWPGVTYDEDFGKTIEFPQMWKELLTYKGLYDPYLTKSPWPRPMLTSDENEKNTALRTDIFNAVKGMKAKLLLSKDDAAFNSEWEKFTNDIKKMNGEEYVKIQQGAYDRFMKK
jgi:putative aldouronate transport system substrate-binding protein